MHKAGGCCRAGEGCAGRGAKWGRVWVSGAHICGVSCGAGGKGWKAWAAIARTVKQLKARTPLVRDLLQVWGCLGVPLATAVPPQRQHPRHAASEEEHQRASASLRPSLRPFMFPYSHPLLLSRTGAGLSLSRPPSHMLCPSPLMHRCAMWHIGYGTCHSLTKLNAGLADVAVPVRSSNITWWYHR